MLNILGEAHGDLGVKLAHELMGRAFEVGHIWSPLPHCIAFKL